MEFWGKTTFVAYIFLYFIFCENLTQYNSFSSTGTAIGAMKSLLSFKRYFLSRSKYVLRDRHRIVKRKLRLGSSSVRGGVVYCGLFFEVHIMTRHRGGNVRLANCYLFGSVGHVCRGVATTTPWFLCPFIAWCDLGSVTQISLFFFFFFFFFVWFRPLLDVFVFLPAQKR